ncbi:hypothetical protein KIL84_008050 [Mauremys mutica]|uniref:Uncharacterized protein n=1 Tax=Mauremys mutica TaxID=74926 RepID=A0A9D3X2H8_9SAUR|nr:hypothetical protein KIL84_008050 [Mauremys mutica]
MPPTATPHHDSSDSRVWLLPILSLVNDATGLDPASFSHSIGGSCGSRSYHHGLIIPSFLLGPYSPILGCEFLLICAGTWCSYLAFQIQDVVLPPLSHTPSYYHIVVCYGISLPSVLPHMIFFAHTMGTLFHTFSHCAKCYTTK